MNSAPAAVPSMLETPVTVEAVTVEEYIASYFPEEPIMQKVAFCESRFRQFGESGTPLRGIVNSSDVGLFQINEYYHGETAEKLGIDLHSLQGNLEYARYLYDREGTQPWSASKPCWSSEHVAVK